MFHESLFVLSTVRKKSSALAGAPFFEYAGNSACAGSPEDPAEEPLQDAGRRRSRLFDHLEDGNGDIVRCPACVGGVHQRAASILRGALHREIANLVVLEHAIEAVTAEDQDVASYYRKRDAIHGGDEARGPRNE